MHSIRGVRPPKVRRAAKPPRVLPEELPTFRATSAASGLPLRYALRNDIDAKKDQRRKILSRLFQPLTRAASNTGGGEKAISYQ
jgi:hypothetical protein